MTTDSLPDSWTGFGRRIAVASGASIGLVSLLAPAPVWVASLRGAATFLAVVLTLRLGRIALEYVDRAQPASTSSESETVEEATRE